MQIKFTDDGLLPFFGPGGKAAKPASPWLVTPLMLVDVFGSTSERRTLLHSLFRLRSDLRELNVQGEQWLDGSFVTAVEDRESRPPKDIDVVTLIYSFGHEHGLPPAMCMPDAKDEYGIDHFPIWVAELSQRGMYQSLVRQVSYFHFLFSHTRSGEPKGMLAVELSEDPSQDLTALQKLRDLQNEP